MNNSPFWDVTPCGSIRTDVSEELTASIRVTRIGEPGATLIMEALSSSETSLTRTTLCNIPEDAILRFMFVRFVSDSYEPVELSGFAGRVLICTYNVQFNDVSVTL
jgi:hypothetical protein